MTQIHHYPFEGNRENLRKLIAGAKRYAKYYPDQFNMNTFNSHGVGPREAPNVVHTCGTTACFAGLGPTIKGLEAIEDDDWWLSYIQRVFGLSSIEMAWDWLFGPDWPDKIEHAIARAEYALDKGIPLNTYEQMAGRAARTYLDYVKPL